MYVGMFCGNLGNIVNRKDLGEKSFKQGFFGEVKAAVFLLFKGYVPLKWRYKTKYGEIDLIVKTKKTLVFVEVKTRPTFEKGYDSISHEQRRRIETTADLFIKKNKKYQNFGTRFDAVIVCPLKWPVHLINLW